VDSVLTHTLIPRGLESIWIEVPSIEELRMLIVVSVNEVEVNACRFQFTSKGMHKALGEGESKIANMDNGIHSILRGLLDHESSPEGITVPISAEGNAAGLSHFISS
jgi:hypothetical protein